MDLVKHIKIASSGFDKDNEIFKHFTGWRDGYGVFTYPINEKNRLIEYVKNQEEHHKIIFFRDEYPAVLKEHEVESDEKYLL